MRFAHAATAVFFAFTTFTANALTSRKPEGFTLIVVPDQYAPIQITHDLSRHYSVVLASYEHPGDAAAPNIHVFQEGRWLNIPQAAFANGSFLRTKPARTIVVGDDNAMTSTLLNSAGAWNVSQVLNIPLDNGTDLINQYGKYFNFGKGEWRWFADKYKLSLIDDGSRRQQSWYDRPYTEDRTSEPSPSRAIALPESRSTPAASTLRPRSASFNNVTTLPGAPAAVNPVTLAPAPAAIPLEPAPSKPAPPVIKPMAPLTPAPVVVKPVVPAPATAPAPAPAPAIVVPVAPAPAAVVEPAAPSVPLKNDNTQPLFQGWKKPEPAPVEGIPAPAK